MNPPTSVSTPDASADPIAIELARYRTLGIRTVLLSFVAFLVWAAWAPLDEGVPAAGQVSIDTKRKAVQHPVGGVVAEVLVKEGEQVQAGATLIKLDAAAAKANLEMVRQRYHALLAAQARLLAERLNHAQPQWPDVLQAAIADPMVAAHMRTQTDLLMARRAGLAAEREAARQSTEALAAQLSAARAAQPIRRAQLESYQTELEALRPLVAEGFAPLNRQRELERQVQDLKLSLNDLVGQQARLQSAMAETRQRQLSREAELRKEAESQLADVTRDVQADAQRIVAVQDDLTRTEIKAPVTGQVVGLGYQTVGGVIPAGQKLMDIVPIGDGLVIEARVPPQVIDRVRNNAKVDVRFSNFAHTPQLVVEGTVLSVSADSLADPQTGMPYFLARIGLTPEGQKAMGTHELLPGMTTEVVFMTGERSLLTYLLHPLTKRLAASMKEE